VTELRVVRAEGTPRERGRHVGRALGELIERSLGFYHGYLERRGVASQQLQDFLAPYFMAAEAETPAYAETIKGMAEGAMVPVWELFAVNSFEELEPLLGTRPDHLSFLETDAGAAPLRPPVQPDRCSTFAVSGPGFTLLGHNEQWLAGDQGNVAVVFDIPGPGSPAVVSPTIVCCLPAVGMNEFGGAQGIQSLVAAGDGVGVPRVLVSRYSLDATDRMDAIRRAAMRGRAGGYGHVFAFRGGDTFIVETTATQHSLLSGSGPHTNHYLDPALGEAAPPPSSGSASRYERLLALIEERHPDSPEGVMEILRDHRSRPQAICRHADPQEGDDAASVLFSVVCDLENQLMWVAPGNPCTTEYEEIDLTSVFAAS
jgi:isopenicillin-N N-acyltransferase-like protein